MLLYIRTLLFHSPLWREPWGQDDNELSRVVQYITWDALLLKHLATETNTEALAWLRTYFEVDGLRLLIELEHQEDANRGRPFFTGPDHESVPANYSALLRELRKATSASHLLTWPLWAREGYCVPAHELKKLAAWT